MQSTELRKGRIGIVSLETFVRFIIIMLFAIIVIMLIAFDVDRPTYYRCLPVLPIGHSLIIGLCLLFNGRLLEEWHTFLAVGIYSVRNLFTPFIMYLGNYHGYFHQLNNENVSYAIALMLYETMIVFLFLSIYGKNTSIIFNDNSYIETRKSNSFKIINVFLLIFCIGVYVFYPNIRDAYTFLFSAEGLRGSLLKSVDLNRGVGQRAIFTLFQVFLPIAYTFFAVNMLCVVNKYLKQNSFFKVFFSLFAILIPSLFMDGGDGNTVIFITALFLTALFIDNRFKGSMIRIAIIGGTAIVVYVFIQAMVSTFIFRKISIWESLSDMFQAYFPGVCNMAGLFNMGSYNKFSQFFYDLYSTIPFRSTLFGLSGFETTPNLYTIDNNALSHIMPCIAHGFYYFGILAPIIPCYMLKKSIDVYKKMKETSDPYRYVTYSLIFFYLVLTPIMYNLLIFLRHFFATFLPMLLICALNGQEVAPESMKQS